VKVSRTPLMSLVPCAALAGALAFVCPAQAQDAGPRPIDPLPDTPSLGDAGALAQDAGPPSVVPLALQARIEPPRVAFGERFDLVIDVTRDRGAPLTLPTSLPESEACPRAGEPRVSVVELSDSIPDAGTPARVKETIRIPYLALDIEKLKTPALVLTAKDGSSLDVPALDVNVIVPSQAEILAGPDGGVLMGPDGGPIPPGQVPLESAASVIAYAVPDERPWVALGTLTITGLALAIARAVQRRLRKRAPAAPAAPPPPPRPAHEIALERLEALLASGLLQQGDTAPFVERLMDEVLRDYIAARFELPAGARTTRELVKELLSVTVAGLDVALVDELLKDADLVKFAKASIAQDRAHAMASRVRALVEATARRVSQTEGA
jgi:hypothetical protein